MQMGDVMQFSFNMHVVPKVWMSELFYWIIHVSNSSMENVLFEQWDYH